MERKNHPITRRDFLRNAATGAALTAASVSVAQQESTTAATQSVQRSRVVLVRDRDALTPAGTPNGPVLARMLDDAVAALFEEKDALGAWRKVARPEDTVGIKTNVWHFLPTPPELEAAIKQRLIMVGVAETRIGVDDRGVLANPIFQRATALINTRPMRTHDWSGVGSLLKNYIMFDPNPPRWHDDSCANLAGVWDLPIVKGKTRLNILVMLTPLFHGTGPHHFNKTYLWEYRGLIVGRDPVAVDATGLRILEAKRRVYFGGDEPFPIPPKHIRVAQDKFGLGNADPDRIDLQVLGWQEDLLL